MYKVLIIDDEGYIISLIEKLIDWKSLDMEVIGSSCDGIQGLSMAQELNPDILIADVMMPGIDGITMIQRIREFNKDIKFVMISGHKQFEYAKSAMKYNVEDYLLKPIDKQELESILKKIKNEIDNRSLAREENLKIKEQLGSNQILMNSLFMENLCLNRLSSPSLSLEKINERYTTTFFSSKNEYCIAILQLNGISQDIISSFLENLLQILGEKGNEILHSEFSNTLSYTDTYRIYYLLEIEPEKKGKLHLLLNRLFDVAKHIVFKYPRLTTTLGVSKTVGISTSLQLSELLRQAITSCDARFKYGYEKVIFFADVILIAPSETLILKDECIEGLKKSIRIASDSEILQHINDIFSFVDKTYKHGHLMYVQTAIQINKELFTYLRMFNDSDSLFLDLNQKLQSKIAESNTIKELVSNTGKHICESLYELREDTKSNLSPAIRMAKRYIDNNYMKNISLTDVAKIINLSPVYFSVIFKKEMGENYVDYLNRIRIDVAKVILRDIQYNISEIAEQCGFSDTRYFARMFKRFVGITPSNYRNKYVMK